MPVLLWHVWRFVTPGLRANEKRWAYPFVLVFLQLSGILTADSLRSARRFAVVGIVALVAVITPSGDPYTLAMLSIPMYVFYEASIVIGLLLTRGRRD